MIDLHCHILPGIDDGPQTVEQSIELARAQVAAGVELVAATPHVNERFPANDAALIAAVRAKLQAELVARRIPLRLAAGAEVALGVAALMPNRELERLRLGDGPWLLVEPPSVGDTDEIAELLRAVRDRGHEVLVAHPERCAGLAGELSVLAELVAEGFALQLTAASLSGRFGRRVARRAERIAGRGLAQVLASDAHDNASRGPGLTGVAPQLHSWMTAQVPAAILAGAPLPPPPPSPRRR